MVGVTDAGWVIAVEAEDVFRLEFRQVFFDLMLGAFVDAEPSVGLAEKVHLLGVPRLRGGDRFLSANASIPLIVFEGVVALVAVGTNDERSDRADIVEPREDSAVEEFGVVRMGGDDRDSGALREESVLFGIDGRGGVRQGSRDHVVAVGLIPVEGEDHAEGQDDGAGDALS